MKKICIVLALSFISMGSLWAQNNQLADAAYRPPLKLSGPRLGFSVLSTEQGKKLVEIFGEDNWSPSPVISLFGWQFEWRYFETSSGAQGLVEVIPLVGGLEQGMFIPSLNTLVGFRSSDGFEVGFGPSISFTNPGFIMAIGQSTSFDQINFPVNFSLATSRDGMRFSFLIGFNRVERR